MKGWLFELWGSKIDLRFFNSVALRSFASSSAFFRPPLACSQTHFLVSSHQLILATKKPPMKGWLFELWGSKIDLRFFNSVALRSFASSSAFFRSPLARSRTHFFVSSHQLILATKKPPMKGWLFSGRGSKKNCFKFSNYLFLKYKIASYGVVLCFVVFHT